MIQLVQHFVSLQSCLNTDDVDVGRVLEEVAGHDIRIAGGFDLLEATALHQLIIGTKDRVKQRD